MIAKLFKRIPKSMLYGGYIELVIGVHRPTNISLGGHDLAGI